MKKRIQKLLAMGLVVVMAFSLAACGGKESTETGGDDDGNKTATATPAPTKEAEVTRPAEKRIITVGTWYDHYYTSEHQTIDVNPNVTDTELAEMQLQNMRDIEEKYNVEFKFINLTWDGTIESINTSIMAGTPDCDIYEVDLQFGIPAALNGYALALEDFLPADSDIFTDQVVMKYLNVLGMDKNYLFKATAVNTDAYPLAFNMEMLEEAGLENPQDLYDRGEWTWEKFREYMIKLTKDTNGDGATDVYGYGGWWTNMLGNLMMSNGTHIAGDTTEGLSSPATIEVMEFIYNMYNVDKVAKPWNSDDWDINTTVYTEKQIAFWPSAHWVFSQYGGEAELGFEIGVVPWPVGPSGNQETNNGYVTAGSYYIMSKGTKDPEFVYNVFYDWINWFDGDTELRDDTEWAENMYMTERNFNYVVDMCKKEQFDIWGSLGLGDAFSMVPIMSGEKTASQYAQEVKNIVQDALDSYFK